MSFRNVASALFAAAGLVVIAACASSDAIDPVAVARPEPGAQPSIDSTVTATPGGRRVFIWSQGGELRVLPIPSHAVEMVATDINLAGQVAGYIALNNAGYTRAFVWSPADGYREIGSLDGPDGLAMALSINDEGVVTGVSVGPEGILNAPMGVPMPHGFVWTAGSGLKSLCGIADLISIGRVNAAGSVLGQSKAGMFLWNATDGLRSLPFPSGTSCSRPVDLNDKGQVLGYAGSAKDCFEFYSPFIWNVDGTQTLIEKCDLSLWCATHVNAINNGGEVTGYRNGAAFKWNREAGFTTFPGTESDSNGEAINDNGDVAGVFWRDQKSTPFVWMASGAITKIQIPAGFRSGYASAINAKGQVVGNFY